MKKPRPTSQDVLIPGPLTKCPPGPPRQRGNGILCHWPRNNHPHPHWLLKAPSAVAFPCSPFFQAGAAAPAISSMPWHMRGCSLAPSQCLATTARPDQSSSSLQLAGPQCPHCMPGIPVAIEQALPHPKAYPINYCSHFADKEA